MTDGEGRVVIFHGVNIMRKLAPYWPDTLTSADAALLSDEGFNLARIGWIWAGAEPSPGKYDDGYMGHLLAFNALLGSYGIRSFIDFHQDSWSQSAGGDCAQIWATLESSGGSDWQDFWADKPAADGVGIQTRFHSLWAHTAKLINASPSAWNVMGLDPINEPNPGSGYPTCIPAASCPAFETSQLTDFYRRVSTAIRGAGDQHIVWTEDEPDHTDFTPAFTSAAFNGPQAAYSWHYYCFPTELTSDPGGVFDVYCDAQTSKAVNNETAYADRMQLPELIGEFGANGADSAYAKQVDAFDGHFLSWAYWVYYIPPGDPSDPAAGSILLDSTKPGSQSNANQTKLDALVVPYPQAIAGTPVSYAFDRSTRAMQLAYTTDPVPGATLASGALTQIFVPHRQYPTGYQVEATGATVVSAPGAPWLELRNEQGAQKVEVTISPTTDGTTALPSQTGILPLSTTSASSR
ncbi:MAG: cellulase family glycosylhydrolase [Nevskia sp.]|nr:cellulase family glycosylhydrolase [Nevskia sp.]